MVQNWLVAALAQPLDQLHKQASELFLARFRNYSNATHEDSVYRTTCGGAKTADLEVHSQLGRQCARRNIMRAAKSGEEVVEGFFVSDIHRRNVEIGLEAIAVEEVA